MQDFSALHASLRWRAERLTLLRADEMQTGWEKLEEVLETFVHPRHPIDLSAARPKDLF